MAPELKRIAAAFEEYCGIRIKRENDFNFKGIVQRLKSSGTPASSRHHINEIFLQLIVEELVIRESCFFREPDYLKLIEEYINKMRGKARMLSLGTSTGEEAYSILMYLTEHNAADRAAVFGGDISRNAIKQTEGGLYSAHSMRRLERRYNSYFTETDRGFLLKGGFRKKVRFIGGFNILRPITSLISGTTFDIITARNFFIYHNKMIEKILSNLIPMIKENGLLITTPVELHKLKMIKKQGVSVTAI